MFEIVSPVSILLWSDFTTLSRRGSGKDKFLDLIQSSVILSPHCTLESPGELLKLLLSGPPPPGNSNLIVLG